MAPNMTSAPTDQWQTRIRGLFDEARQVRRAGSGELIIMGSGLAAGDLSADLTLALGRADQVFYCLADVLTEAIIRGRRPDALDLAVLYNGQQERYSTYVQMAEVMLKPVRTGERVLSIFYGHPGVFAMPTHRAAAIAKKEGLSVRMYPAVSALDYLIADVGFDPAYPGLLSYEATDFLLRNRRLDPSIHVVLWQIGVLGEMGYSRLGFKNSSLSLLVERLEAQYGDATLTHYIGSRFPGVPSLVQTCSAKGLLEEPIVSRITALSTLYLPPIEPCTTSQTVAESMGLKNVNYSEGAAIPVYDNTRYGPHEQAALKTMKDFVVPGDYVPFRRTPGVTLMLDLQNDPHLRERFARSPSEVMNEPAYASLSAEARKLLASREVSQVHHAMYLPGAL